MSDSVGVEWWSDLWKSCCEPISFPFIAHFSPIFNSRLQKDFHISVVKMLQNWLGMLFGCQRGKKKKMCWLQFQASGTRMSFFLSIFLLWILAWLLSPHLLGPERSCSLPSASALTMTQVHDLLQNPSFWTLSFHYFPHLMCFSCVVRSACVCVMSREADRCVYTESTALLTALNWSGSGGTGTPDEARGRGMGYRSGGDAAMVKATQTACRYSHRKHRHHHIAFQSLA